MASPYSYDLRTRVIKFLDDGGKIFEASKVFNIARKTIIEWKKIRKETGDFKAETGYHTGHRRKITDVEGFRKFIEENSDKTGAELAEKWHEIQSKNDPSATLLSATTVTQSIRKLLGFSIKKNFFSSKKRRSSKGRISKNSGSNP